MSTRPMTFGCQSTTPHSEHVWTSTRFGHVQCNGLDTPTPAKASRVAGPDEYRELRDMLRF